MIQLSNIAPDFDDLVTQLLTAAGDKPQWSSRLTTETTTTLIKLIAASGAYSQFSIESGLQECYPESAKNDNSLYAAANYSGVRYNRKLPASVTVMMAAPSALTVPVNSQFNGAGTYWFNRVPLSLSTTPVEVTLYQGQVVNASLYGLNTDFQAFITPEKGFVVSDIDVLLKINSVSVPAEAEGLWTKKDVPGAWQFTLPSGQMILLFGNTIYGSKPNTSDLCEIQYIVTLGEDGANIPTLAKSFSLETNPLITGEANTQASGGGSQSNPLVYKNVTPALFGAFNSSVTGSQYKKLPLQYPGVIDGFTLAQREVNPRALTWMNVIKVCLLTQSPWTAPNWNDFETWFNKNTMYAPRIFREDPVAAPVAVDAIVRCKNLANLGEVQINVEAALDKLFAPRQGIIGMDIYRSDITDAILEADSNIDFVILNSPTTDIVLRSLNVPAPTFTVLPTGGFLGPGVYDYAVSIVSTLGGQTAPAFWSQVEITSGATNRIVVQWQGGQANVSQYKLWGRQTPDEGLLTTVAGNVLSYTDTGGAVPSGVVPVQSTIASYYPRLTSKTLTMLYTNRDSIT